MYNLENYCTISKVVSDAEYAREKHIRVKRVNVSDNVLYMLNYDKSKITKENVSSLGLFRSVITDGENVLCFSPPKSEKYLDFIKTESYENVVLEDFVEGTMINLFYHNNEWQCSTRGTIGAKCKFFRDYPKTYRILFLEAMEECKLEFNMLNTDYCYSFVVQHLENRIVVPFSGKRLVLTNMYKCENNVVENVDLKHAFPGYSGSDEEGPEIYLPKTMNELYSDYKGNSFGELFDYFTSLNLDYKTVGLVIKSGTRRVKIWNPNYLKVKGLRGNNPKIQFQYYHLLRDKKLKEFLQYYPEYRQCFDNYKVELFGWTEQLWSNYKSCYIRKEKPLIEFPKHFRTHMYHIHDNYLNVLRPNNRRVDKLVVINYVNSLEPPLLMHSINFMYKEKMVDEEKSKLEVINKQCVTE